MVARLSQKGLNNVVIFAMLAMMFLFNIGSFIPAAKAPATQPILAEDSYVLKIQHDNQSLERVGQQWRWVGLQHELITSPQQQIDAWYKARLLSVTKASGIEQMSPHIVVVWLAGDAQGQVFAFYPTSSDVWVYYKQSWFTLEGVALSQLLPWLE
jgi:hypothetical protein